MNQYIVFRMYNSDLKLYYPFSISVYINYNSKLFIILIFLIQEILSISNNLCLITFLYLNLFSCLSNIS